MPVTPKFLMECKQRLTAKKRRISKAINKILNAETIAMRTIKLKKGWRKTKL